MRSSPRAERAFTLLELVVVLAVVAVLAAALAAPAAAHLQMRRAAQAQWQLEEWRDTILGFAAAHGRLPCPATADSRGFEAFARGADAANGTCADFHAGFLPAATLGLSPLDPEGFMRDPWQTAANRVRYAVYSGTVNGVPHTLTRTNGMQQASLAALGESPAYLYVCAGAGGASDAGCGPAANQLTRRAAFVLLSLGPNAPVAPPPGSDEARNLDGNGAFVAHESRADGFDDIVHWASIHLVVHRMVAAGRLP